MSMKITRDYEAAEPARADVDGWQGLALLEFGAPWCGYCIGAQEAIAEGLAQAPEMRHLKIEDGKGRPLGRSFRVKLWPTLVFLRDGREVARVVRPHDAHEVRQAMRQMLGDGSEA